MSVAPAVLTDPILTTRESQPVVLVTSEEILTVQTPAYSMNKSDISFLVRQPSGSAICSSYAELILTLQFTLSNNATVKARIINGVHDNLALRYRFLKPAAAPALGGGAAGLLAATNAHISDYGFVPELLPIQNKCVRNAVITINGSSQSMRVNEFGKEYNILHLSRKMANKIGNGINDYKKRPVYRATSRRLGAETFSGRYGPGKSRDAVQDASNYVGFREDYVDSEQQCMQHDKWMQYMLQDGSVNSLAGQPPPWVHREPLFIGPFSAFQACDSFPAWSCEGQKSPGLLHMHSLQLQLAMEDNWWRNMYLQLTNADVGDGGGAMAQVTNVQITAAELQTKWYLPPPRLVSAALTQTVSYATYDVLRFIATAHSGANPLNDGDNCSFKLNAVSFPYMPSLFVFSIKPHYAFSTAAIGNKRVESTMLEAMKGDKRMAITHIDLSINTSAKAINFRGTDNIATRRLNARELYEMTLENCANVAEFPYTFDEWYKDCGFVAISPAQLSGTLNSPNIRGSVVLQGMVHGRNMMGFPVNIQGNNTNLDNAIANNGEIYANNTAVPRYQCFISGFYSNRSLVLDAKSGIISENTFSASFQQSLRLGSSQAS